MTANDDTAAEQKPTYEELVAALADFELVHKRIMNEIAAGYLKSPCRYCTPKYLGGFPQGAIDALTSATGRALRLVALAQP